MIYFSYYSDTKTLESYSKGTYEDFVYQFNKVDWTVIRHIFTDEIRLRGTSGDLVKEGKIMFNDDGMLLNIIDHHKAIKHMKKHVKSMQTEQKKTYWRE